MRNALAIRAAVADAGIGGKSRDPARTAGLRRVFVLAGTLAFGPIAHPAPGRAETPPIPLTAQVGGDMERTRFTAFLSKKVDYRIFSIADPARLVIDLPEADIQVPGDKGRGLVLSSRAGVLSEGKSRIVIDLAEPATVEKSEMLAADNGLPARLVLDIRRSTYKAFLAVAKSAPDAAPITSAKKAVRPADAQDVRPLIVIDPGHGGVDAGAHGHVTAAAEKDVTLAVGLALRDKLLQSGRYRVFMTRDTDVFVALEERADMASSRKADILISIHVDTLPKLTALKDTQEIRGGTIYTLSEQPSDERAKALAQQENKSDAEAGLITVSTANASAEIDTILNDLETRGKKNRSLGLANYLVAHLKDKMRFNMRPHREANLRVLKATGVPAILFELGYFSNDEDEKLLISKDWQMATAGAVANAVDAFLAARIARLPL